MAEYDVKELNITKGGNTYKIKGETYESKSAASGGTDLSLVTTGEKYTWNNKSGSDTKNTTGTTNKTGTKMFIAAATEQSANPTTYSNSNVYIGTDNCLYSGGAKVLTAHQDISGKKNTQSAVSDPSASGTSVTFISTISQNAQGVISPTKKTVRTMSGASSSAAGSTGLVPAPAAGDQAKFLKGNGTWDVPEGSRLWTVDLDTVTVSTAGSYTHTTTVTNMSGSMKAAVIECGHPEIFKAPVVITTATNSVTLTCSSVAVGSSTVKVSFLMQGDNASPLSSGEYNALSGQIGTLANLNTDVKTNLVAAVNSVNSNNTYSTTEKAVGKWIDGSIVYRISGFYHNTLSMPLNSWTTLFTIGQNLKPIKITGTVNFGLASTQYFSLPSVSPQITINYNTDGTIKIYNSWTNDNGEWKIYWTIYYMK